MLIIEKVVKLLDDFHYEVLKNHIRHHSKRSYYPQTLFEIIDRDLMKLQTSEELFAEVYADEEADEANLKKLYQLAHHTFKLTSFLARNYPDYLHHNISRIQMLINTGELNQANTLAEILLEIVKKTEDHHTEIRLLQLLAQKEILLESYDKALKYQERVAELLGFEQTLNELNSYIYTHLNPKVKAKKTDVTHLDYFKSFHDSKSFSIRTISIFYYCHTLYYLREEYFYSDEILHIIIDLEADLKRNDYIVFPYMSSILRGIDFIKIQAQLRRITGEEILVEIDNFLNNSDNTLYWNSFINFMEIFALSVQSSIYSSKYMRSYRKDYYQTLSQEIKEKINQSKKKCLNLLNNKELEEKFTLRYINLATIYGILLVCGDKQDLEEASILMINTIYNFQQIPFHSYIDPIYTIIIFSNFSLGKYKEVDEHYKRYRRSTKGKIVNPENDLLLHGFYYASKWVETNRKQYLKKFAGILAETITPNLQRTHRILSDVVDYFAIPIESTIKN